MGIKDLLRFMRPYVEAIHIKKFAGKRLSTKIKNPHFDFHSTFTLTCYFDRFSQPRIDFSLGVFLLQVGIDAYSWLHKGAYSCNMELCLNMEGDKKLQYLNYCMHRINMLRHYDISPVVVFDGGNISCKAITEQDRHIKRKANRELALTKFKEGDVNAASEIFQRAVSITPAMAHQLIEILISENIEFVVAPYEADAQLAYLSSLKAEEGGIVAVISEDSDLLVYGCPAIVFKMDRYGSGEEIMLDKVLDSVGRVPSFRLFDKELFTGIGIAKAHSLVSKYRNLDRALSVLKFDKGDQMPEDYLKSFKEAFAVFQHARIYDAVSKELKHLKPIPQQIVQSLNEELDFLGPEISSSVATAIAEGKLDPRTMEAYSHFPSSKSHLKPTPITKTPARFPKQEACNVSTQQSCFTVVSSQKTGTKRITVMKPELALEGWERKGTLEGWRNVTEAVELQKLMSPVKCEKKTSTAKKSSIVPDNNPFKKRKVQEVQLEKTDCVTEQGSVVTEVVDLEVLCLTPESQQSVDSKPIQKTDEQKRSKNETKLNRSNGGGPENKESIILKFFSPL